MRQPWKEILKAKRILIENRKQNVPKVTTPVKPTGKGRGRGQGRGWGRWQGRGKGRRRGWGKIIEEGLHDWEAPD